MIEHPMMQKIVAALTVLLISLIIGQLVKWILSTVFKRIFSATKTTLDDRMLCVIRPKVTTVSAIIGFYIGLKIIRGGLEAGDITYNHIVDYLEVSLYLFLVFVLARLISRIIETTFEWYTDDVSQKTHSNITATVAPMMKKIVDLVLFLIAGMIILDHFGVNIGSLLVSLGVGSLAVALAAQETVANMIAGFVILIDQPFRVGDRIKLPSGEEGDVTQIGLRSTHILNYDNNLVVVPNSELVKNRLINFSFPENSIRVLIEVKVAYGTDIENARAILLKLAAENVNIISDPAPSVFFMEFAESGVLLRLSARTSHFDKKFEIETLLREQIYKEFGKAGIEIPLPKRVVYTQELDEIQTDKKK
jgi:MscS family membrane protein